MDVSEIVVDPIFKCDKAATVPKWSNLRLPCVRVVYR